MGFITRFFSQYCVKLHIANWHQLGLVTGSWGVMSIQHVVILSCQSLLAAGTASRLREKWDSFEITVIDIHDPAKLEKIVALHPRAVIMDSSSTCADSECTAIALLQQIPDLKLIRLDVEKDNIQVVSSVIHHAHTFDDLIDVIDPGA